MPTTKKRTKTVATTEAVKAAAGKTWFDVSDEGSHIELSSRDHGDVGAECPGKADIEEGKRLLRLLRRKYRPARWKLTFEIVDEWVSVNLRKEPYTKAEIAETARKAKLASLRSSLSAAVLVTNETTAKEGHRSSFSSYVHDGDYSKKATLKVVFGKRYLYLDHLGSRFLYADEDAAEAAIKPLVSRFPELAWTRTVREPTARRTGNKPPPHNIIEEEGYIEYEADIRKL